MTLRLNVHLLLRLHRHGITLPDLSLLGASLLSTDLLEASLPGVTPLDTGLRNTGLRDAKLQGAVLRGITVGKFERARRRGRRWQTGTVTAGSKDDIYELRREAADI